MNKFFINRLKIFYFLIIFVLLLPCFINISYADETNTTNITDVQNTSNDALTLYSKSSILIDASSGQILYEHNAREKMYPASTTKLMTAILTLENCKLTDEVTITKEAISGIPAGYTTAALQPGETLSVDQLLHVLLIPSANDAASVLACHISGSVDNFAVLMNKKAKELGCENTNFVNANGIHNDNHFSTAYDMALIGKFANTFDIIQQITTQTSYSLPALPNGKERNFKTTNTLITPNNKYYYQYANGLKTGYTEKAKSCIVAKAKKDDIELICVVLCGSKTLDLKCERELDCHTLFDYGFNNYSYKNVCEKSNLLDNNILSDIPTYLSGKNLAYSDNLSILVPKQSNISSVQTQITWNNNIALPIYKNTVVGNIKYTVGENSYTVNIVSAEDILPMNSHQISYLFYILVALLVIALIFTIFYKKKNKYHKKSQGPKYFKHSFY